MSDAVDRRSPGRESGATGPSGNETDPSGTATDYAVAVRLSGAVRRTAVATFPC